MDGYNAHDASVSTQQELFESGSLSPSAPNIKKISDRHLGPIGKKQATPFSKRQIESFIDFFHINMNEFEPSDIDGYATFEDFFVRAHKPGSRPIHAKNDATKAVVMYDTVAESIKIWIKGTDFIITNLVMDRQLGPLFDDRAVASFRLSPQDYHRYHSPISGKAKLFRSLPGDYYQVDPMALRSDLDILSRNTRDYVVIESEEFGDVLFVAIGATDVGSVLIHENWQKPGSYIKKGDELGVFQFGGSSIGAAFEKGRIEFDKDLLDVDKAAITIDVEDGMSLGKALKPSS